MRPGAHIQIRQRILEEIDRIPTETYRFFKEIDKIIKEIDHILKELKEIRRGINRILMEMTVGPGLEPGPQLAWESFLKKKTTEFAKVEVLIERGSENDLKIYQN